MRGMPCVPARSFGAIALVAAMLLGGCGSSSGSNTGKAPPQVLRISDEGVQDLADADLDPPAENSGSPAIQVISMVFGGLVRLDQNLQVVPDDARAYTLSSDGRTYTFTLRNGLKFADGTPVTAADFAYSLNRAFSPKFANGNTNYYLSHVVGGPAVTQGKAKTIAGVKVINASTLQITTDMPTAPFLDQLTFSASYVVPKHLIDKYGKTWTEHAVGTGPFFVKRWQHGKEIDLAPNPYYWRGKPKLKLVRILFFRNPDTAYTLYRTGGLDVTGVQLPPINQLARARKQPGFQQVAQLATTYLTPNERKSPFNSVHVRRAFSFAINRSLLVNKLLGGQFSPAHTILPPGIPGYNAATKGESFDPARAKQELGTAGYPDGRAFPGVTLNFDNGDSGQHDSAEVLKRFWKRYLNVTVQLSGLDHRAYNILLTTRNYQLAFISWGADYPDAQNFLSLQLQTGNGNNSGSFSDPTFDALTKQADTLAGNNARRYGLYRRAEGIALQKAAWIVLYHPKSGTAINPRVHGLLVNGGGLTAGNWATVAVS